MYFYPKKTASARIGKQNSVTEYLTLNNGINPETTANADSIASGLELMASIGGYQVNVYRTERTIVQGVDEE